MSRDKDIKHFVQTYKITFPVGRDDGIAEIFGVRNLPVTFFLGKNGKVVKKHIGAVSYAELEVNIEALLKDPALK